LNKCHFAEYSCGLNNKLEQFKIYMKFWNLRISTALFIHTFLSKVMSFGLIGVHERSSEKLIQLQNFKAPDYQNRTEGTSKKRLYEYGGKGILFRS